VPDNTPEPPSRLIGFLAEYLVMAKTDSPLIAKNENPLRRGETMIGFIEQSYDRFRMKIAVQIVKIADLNRGAGPVPFVNSETGAVSIIVNLTGGDEIASVSR
jgi:hypothetical protein